MIHHRPEAMLVMGDDAFRSGFDQSRLARLRELVSLTDPMHVTSLSTPAAQRRLAEVEVLITGWGSPLIDADVLRATPNLRAVVHTAGSVKHVVDRICWDNGVRVTTAAEANAIPVAEYTVAAILFAGKRVIESARLYKDVRRHARPAGPISNYQRTVGIIGYSRIGRRVVSLLRPFDVEVFVADPYADTAQITAAGAAHVGLEELLRRSGIVSVHAPDLPATRHMLDKDRLALIPDGGTVINTARGALIDTGALEAECRTRRLSAILDVTDPEPLDTDSALWDMRNVFITPHVAGAQQTEIHRLFDSALDELDRYVRGEPPLHGVTADDLDRIA